MEASTKLRYAAAINVAGNNMSCLESYESIVDRMREAAFTMTSDDAESGEMNWAAPLELTVQGPEGRPLRAAVALQAIAYVIELPEDERTEVAE